MLTNKIDLSALTRINKARCLIGFHHTLDSWKTSQWTNAIAGETGEACNIAKKMDRILDGINGNKPEDNDLKILRANLGKELADIVIYADLAASSLGFDLTDLIVKKFNEKSREIDSDLILEK